MELFGKKGVRESAGNSAEANDIVCACTTTTNGVLGLRNADARARVGEDQQEKVHFPWRRDSNIPKLMMNRGKKEMLTQRLSAYHGKYTARRVQAVKLR